jgi:hypothetical protein
LDHPVATVSITRCVVRRPSDEPKERLGERPPDGGAMMYTMPYQTYKSERGLTTAAEQRAADVRAGEAAAALAAALGDLRLSLGRVFRRGQRVQPAPRVADMRPGREAADAVTGPARVLSTIR